MGTGSSVVTPVVDEGVRSRQVTQDSENNNIRKGVQGNGVSYSLQVQALLPDYKNVKPNVVPHRARSFQVRRSEPITSSTRRVKYPAPQPPVSVAPFCFADVVKNVAVASVGEVKVTRSPVGKRHDFAVTVPKITLQENTTSDRGSAVAMTDNRIGETILERNGVGSMASHTSPNPRPIPSPRVSKSESMTRLTPHGSPASDRMVKRRNTELSSRLARSQPLPKMRQTLSPPVIQGDGHIKQLSDDCVDHKPASVKPCVHPRQHLDPHSFQEIMQKHPNHTNNEHFIQTIDTQKESIRTMQKEQQLKTDTQRNSRLESEESDFHTHVASSDADNQVLQQTKPTPKPRAVRPNSFNSGLKVDLVVANNCSKTRSWMMSPQTPDSSLGSSGELVHLNLKRNKGLVKSNSEEHSDGYHSAISSQVEDGPGDHDDDDDIVMVSEKSTPNKTKMIQVTPVQSTLSPTSPVRPRHSSYPRAMYSRSSTLSSNDSLDSVEEYPLGFSYESTGTQAADDERSDILGDSVRSLDLLSSSDSIALHKDEAVQLRKKRRETKNQVGEEESDNQRLGASCGEEESDNQRLGASCEALNDNFLRASLPEDLWSLRLQKSKSLLDVPDKSHSPVLNNSPGSSPRSGASSPRQEKRFRQYGLDSKLFFQSFKRMQGSTSPNVKRRTAPIMETSECPGREPRKSTPVELFTNPNPPDYETTLNNVVEGITKVNRVQPDRGHAWRTGPEIRVKRPSISTAFDSDHSPDNNLAGLNLEGLNQTYPASKHGKKASRRSEEWFTTSPRYSRRSKGLTLSLKRRDNRLIEPNAKVKDTLLLFPPEGFTLTPPHICHVIDLDTAVEETSYEADFEVQRIPEYGKYLQELRSETSETHPDYEELTKTAQRVSNMVKEREEEMSNAENEYKVDNVQDRFPNDDLQLNEKEKSNQRYRALQTRRRSAPSAVLIKSIGVKNRGAPNINSRPLPFASDDLSTSRPHNANRAYLLEGPVQLTAGIQPQERYLFLFNDILLIAKKKSATTFKLKTRVRVCELWLTKNFLEDVTEASSSACPPERSFVIGWPTTNMVATFGTADLKDLWLSKLTSQISAEKDREVPKTVLLRILNKEMPGYASSKNITVMNTEEVNDVIKMCLEQFEISDAKPEDYQIWVRSGKEGTMLASAYPLFGHEHPYSIKMSHTRDAAKATGHVILPQDTDLGSDTVPPEHQCQFIIKHKSKSHFLNISNKKNSRRSPIASLFRRSVSRRDLVDFDLIDPATQGKLFGQRLADICVDDVFPKPVMDLLTRLFHEGPTATGILRKSANKRLCENLKALFDEEKDYSIDDWSILVIGDTLKLFFREMPDSIIGSDLYEKFVATCDITDQDERVDEVRRMIESLPKCNQNLLKHFFCVLHRIDDNNKENNMNAYNLSVCVRPSILRNPTPGSDCKDPLFQEQLKRETECVQFVIENFIELFGEEALKLFGEPKTTMRQDSGTDSDSMHSILSMPETGGLRRDDSSLDSLDRELYNTEMDSSPQLAKSHLSPTNLSRDSGLTLSDTQLYEESGESENSNNSGGRPELVFSREDLLMPVPPPRSKRRRGSEPQTNIDTARVLARMCALPGNGALASGMGQEKIRGSVCHSMSGDVIRTMKHGGQLQTKKLSMESLRSVEENSECEFNPDFQRFQSSGDIGVLRKSSSGAKLFFDEDIVMTHRADDAVPSVAHAGLTVSCDNRRSSTEYSSQDSEPSIPGSPNLYRRVWVADGANASKPVSLSASYGGSSHQYQNSLNPNYVPQSCMTSANRLSAPKQCLSRSAPSTPNESSPSSSPRGSFSKYLSKDSDGSSRQASSTDQLSNDSDRDGAPPVPPKLPTLSLTNAPLTKSGKYSDTVGCGSPPPDVILRNQLYKGQQGPEQIFDFDSPKSRGVDRTRLAHDVVSSCSSDDDDRQIRSVASSLNSCGSQEQTDRVGTAVSRKNCLQKKTFVEKSSSDTNVLKRFHQTSSEAVGRRDNGQVRPDRPPSYQEAIHRKILLKSGNGTTQAVTYTDKDVVEQSANSANARKLYEESLKKYNQAIEVSSSSVSSKSDVESRPGFLKHSISCAIQEEPSTPPKSPATVKRSRSDTDKMKELKSQFQKGMFYSPGDKEKKEPVKDNEKAKKREVLRRQSAGSGNPSTRYSDCTLVKEDKNAATVQYYKALVKTAPEQSVMRRKPPPYRHPPPIQLPPSASGSKVKDKEVDDRPRLRRQGSGPKPAVDLDTIVCTEESLV